MSKQFDNANPTRVTLRVETITEDDVSATEYNNFVAFTRALLAVPKGEIDRARSGQAVNPA
ncbi:MAG: hypothetical protein WD271_15160 [Acidimicrobiia bacterium]